MTIDLLPGLILFSAGLLLGTALGIKIATAPSSVKIKGRYLVDKRYRDRLR